MCIGVRRMLGACLRHKEGLGVGDQVAKSSRDGEVNTGNADEEGPKGGVNPSSEDQVMKRAGENRRC